MDAARKKPFTMSKTKSAKLLMKPAGRSTKTRLEDLSNELLYEIFEFLDAYDVYEIFSNLNIRFNHLTMHSSLPFKLKFSLLSKNNFQHRCEKILMPNIHRIQSLGFSQHFLIDHFFKIFSLNSSFSRLESLCLLNSSTDQLAPILSTLIVLPRLYYLTISTIEDVKYQNTIYGLIVRLPKLKYCQLSLGSWNRDVNLSLTYSNHTYCSSIENLVLHTKYELDQLNNILVCMPNLNRLSCRISVVNNTLINMAIISSKLVYLSVKLENISFDEFQWGISTFSHQLEYLRISSTHDIEFLNAYRWQHFILCHMPNLKRFYFWHRLTVDANLDRYDRYHTLIDQFKSSFWINRKWFFTHEHYRSKNLNEEISFYSIKPFKWHHYYLYEDSCRSCEVDCNFAYKVELHNYTTMHSCPIAFLRTNRLTLSGENHMSNSSLIYDLTQRFCSAKLTELIISDRNLRLEHLLLFLHHFPNLQSLTIPTSILSLYLPQSENNRLTINKNNVLHVSLTNQCTLEDVQILNRFCPCLLSLDIEADRENLGVILHFLLIVNRNRNQRERLSTSTCTNNIVFWQQEYSACTRCLKNQNAKLRSIPCNHYLSSLCFRDANYAMKNKLRAIIDQEALLSDYVLEYLNQNIYIWW